MITVNSDQNRKPRYYVTDGKEKVLYKSEWAHRAIQWAIDHTNVGVVINMNGTFDLKDHSHIQGRRKEEPEL